MTTHSVNYIELDLSALAQNLDYIKQLAGADKAIIASIKANAYGHDLKHVAHTLHELGVDTLATGSLTEARMIRQIGIDTPLLLFSFSTPESTIQAAAEGFISTVPNLETAIDINAGCTKPMPIYLKIDCGLGRLGEPLTRAKTFIKTVSRMSRLKIEGVYTHVPFAREAASDWAREKLDAFDELMEELKEDGYPVTVTQAMASCCLLAGLQDRSTSVCVGHALYGLSPFDPSHTCSSHPLRPVMKSIVSRLIHIGRHVKGSDIAVRGLYQTAKPHAVGVLPVGKSMGLRGPVEGKSMNVLVRGQACPVLSVHLEHTTIGLDALDNANLGDTATFVGRDANVEISIADLAESWAVRPLEALMRLSGRFPVKILEPKPIAAID